MIPQLKRLLDSDLPGSPDWMKTALVTLNKFMQDTYSVLKKGITFQDNIRADIKELNLRAPVSEFKVPSTIQVPIGVLLLGVTGKLITSEPVLQWSPTQGGVLIDSISGLTSGNEYKVRILII